MTGDRYTSPSRLDTSGHRRAGDKVRSIPLTVEADAARSTQPRRKPSWIRARAQTHPRVRQIKRILRERNLHEEFDRLADVGHAMGFAHVPSGPMLRSSYHADEQAAVVLAPTGLDGASARRSRPRRSERRWRAACAQRAGDGARVAG